MSSQKTLPSWVVACDTADREQPLTVQVSRTDMFCVIVAVQLACRHPAFTGPTRKIAECVARQIQEAYPAEAKRIIELGWNWAEDEIVTRE